MNILMNIIIFVRIQRQIDIEKFKEVFLYVLIKYYNCNYSITSFKIHF